MWKRKFSRRITLARAGLYAIVGTDPLRYICNAHFFPVDVWSTLAETKLHPGRQPFFSHTLQKSASGRLSVELNPTTTEKLLKTRDALHQGRASVKRTIHFEKVLTHLDWLWQGLKSLSASPMSDWQTWRPARSKARSGATPFEASVTACGYPLLCIFPA